MHLLTLGWVPTPRRLERKSSTEPFTLSMQLQQQERPRDAECNGSTSTAGSLPKPSLPPPLLPSSAMLDPTLDNDAAALAETLLDAAEHMEDLATASFDTAQAVLHTRKTAITLFASPQSQSQSQSSVAYLHLGPTAHLAIHRRDPLNPRKRLTVCNAMIAFADVVVVECKHGDDVPWIVGVEPAAGAAGTMALGVMCV